MNSPTRPQSPTLPPTRARMPWLVAVATLATLVLGAGCDLYSQPRDHAGADMLCGGQPSPECPQW